MTAIPDDIMKAAEEAYREVNEHVDPRADSFEAAKIRAFHNPVKIGIIARAILAERERLEKELAALRDAATRQGDNMAFVINHVTLPDQWLRKFMVELEEDRAAIIQPSSASSSSPALPCGQERDQR